MDVLAYRMGQRRAAGYCLLWDALTDGREKIDLTETLGLCFYRVSGLVFSEEMLTDVHIVGDDLTVTATPTTGCTVVGDAGWVGVFADGELPILLSACKGSYEYEGVTVEIPADGTYFVHDPENGVLFRGILKPAAV